MARRAERRGELLAYWKRWRSEHQDWRNAYNQNRRARLSGNGGTHTAEEWTDCLARFDHRCVYCGRAGLLTKDHAVPISRGGTNDITNIVPACTRCNIRKHDKTASEFLAWLKTA